MTVAFKDYQMYCGVTFHRSISTASDTWSGNIGTRGHGICILCLRKWILIHEISHWNKPICLWNATIFHLFSFSSLLLPTSLVNSSHHALVVLSVFKLFNKAKWKQTIGRDMGMYVLHLVILAVKHSLSLFYLTDFTFKMSSFWRYSKNKQLEALLWIQLVRAMDKAGTPGIHNSISEF